MQGKYKGQVVAVKKLIMEQEDGEDEGETVSKVFGEFRREVWVMRYFFAHLSHFTVANML